MENERRSKENILYLLNELKKQIESENYFDILKLIENENIKKKIIKEIKIITIIKNESKKFNEINKIKELTKILVKKLKEKLKDDDDDDEDGEEEDNNDGNNEDNEEDDDDEDNKKEEDNNRNNDNDSNNNEDIPLPRNLRNQTYTITFGDQAENHVGMQKIGKLSNEGFQLNDLQRAKEWFESRGIVCELINLHEKLSPSKRNPSLPSTSSSTSSSPLEAYVLVARNGVSAILSNNTSSLSSLSSANELMNEQFLLPKDTHAFMYGRVVNKHARYNLCFSSFNQEPDYENGKGRVIDYNSVPLLKQIREEWINIIGEKGNNLEAEGNYYYDITKCGIGYHGDTERKKVIAIRMGETIPLYYVWYENSIPISDRIKITLNHGDVYFMSEKATGQDWKRKTFPTLRHATGIDKFVDIKKPKKNKK